MSFLKPAVLKYLIYGFNILLFVFGIGLIVCGSLILSSFQSFLDLVGTEFTVAASMIIACGAIMLGVAFLGFYGAFTDNYCMVYSSFWLLLVTFILKITAIVLAFTLRGTVDAAILNGLSASIDEYETNPAIRAGWDDIQSRFECCGVEQGHVDWSGKLSTKGYAYPKSCCKPDARDRSGCGSYVRFASEDTCVPKLRGHIDSNNQWIGGIGIFLSIFPILGMIPTFFLAKSLKAEYEAA